MSALSPTVLSTSGNADTGRGVGHGDKGAHLEFVFRGPRKKAALAGVWTGSFEHGGYDGKKGRGRRWKEEEKKPPGGFGLFGRLLFWGGRSWTRPERQRRGPPVEIATIDGRRCRGGGRKVKVAPAERMRAKGRNLGAWKQNKAG